MRLARVSLDVAGDGGSDLMKHGLAGAGTAGGKRGGSDEEGDGERGRRPASDAQGASFVVELFPPR